MAQLLLSFALGVIYQDPVRRVVKSIMRHTLEMYHNYSSSVNKDKSDTVEMYFLCRVTNEQMFNDCFPAGKVQPYWEYNQIQKTIKVYINDPDVIQKIFDNEVLVNDLIDDELDISFFKDLGDCYLYIDYYLNGPKTNVYDLDHLISPNDFKTIYEGPTYQLLKQSLCISVITTQTIFLTLHVKKFVNNKSTLTAEKIIYTYDRLENNDYYIEVLDSKTATPRTFEKHDYLVF